MSSSDPPTNTPGGGQDTPSEDGGQDQGQGPPPAPGQGLVTPDEVRRQENMIGRIRSAFGIDDDFLAAMLANQVQLARIGRQQSQMLSQIASGGDSGVSPSSEFSFSVSLDVPANTTRDSPATDMIEVPYDGNITGLMVGWPGISGAVGISLRRQSGERLFPRNDDDEYESMPTATVGQFDMNVDVVEGEEIIGQYVNFDSVNSHYAAQLLDIESSEATTDDNDGS